MNNQYRYIYIYLRQISPVSAMFGCHILVKHLTLGGCGEQNMVCHITALPGVHVWVCVWFTRINLSNMVNVTFHDFAQNSGCGSMSGSLHSLSRAIPGALRSRMGCVICVHLCVYAQADILLNSDTAEHQ